MKGEKIMYKINKTKCIYISQKFDFKLFFFIESKTLNGLYYIKCKIIVIKKECNLCGLRDLKLSANL